MSIELLTYYASLAYSVALYTARTIFLIVILYLMHALLYLEIYNCPKELASLYTYVYQQLINTSLLFFKYICMTLMSTP